MARHWRHRMPARRVWPGESRDPNWVPGLALFALLAYGLFFALYFGCL